jgi:hypothetical protein
MHGVEIRKGYRYRRNPHKSILSKYNSTTIYKHRRRGRMRKEDDNWTREKRRKEKRKK